MSIRDEAIEIIESSATTADAAENLLGSSRSVILYVLGIGIESLKAKTRRAVRQILKREIQPEYVKGPVTGSIRFSKKTIQRLSDLGDRLWADWKIGVYSLADMTREQIIVQIESEKKSAHGSLMNVNFYGAIIEPMKDGQTVKEVWTPKKLADLKRRVYNEDANKRPTLR